MADLRPEALTWTALLARWIEFAKASVAIPEDEDGDRWRASVAAVINLQAVTFALADLDGLPADERALARDKAAILIRDNVQIIDDAWRGRSFPPALMDTCVDARAALVVARYAGATELVWPGPGPMVMPAVDLGAPAGTLAIMQPGTIVWPGEPVAWWVNRPAVEVEGCEPRATAHPDQVYRQINDDGAIVRDVLAPVESDLPPGLPLLVPIDDDGARIGHFTMEAAEWEHRQLRATPTGGIKVIRWGIDR